MFPRTRYFVVAHVRITGSTRYLVVIMRGVEGLCVVGISALGVRFIQQQ